ncbi:MAG: monovalent cation/H(+) antiporter subunit G [Mobilicoccus sp.]|nr:monovalent cation/H(+) antiporter subunit G [Mobilicoccus sp.]
MSALALLGDVITVVSAVIGAAFFTAGTIGLLRFADLRSRLHALAKADGLGLGFVVLALLPQAGSIGAAAKILLIYVLAVAAAAASAHLLALDPPARDEAAA